MQGVTEMIEKHSLITFFSEEEPGTILDIEKVS